MDCETLRDEILEVLYGEADREARARVGEHLSVCPACREEMASLRAVRRDLAAWRLPAPRGAKGLGLTAGLAAAVVLVLGGGVLALGGAELRYGQGGVSLRLGRAVAADVEARLAEQESRLRTQIEALRAGRSPASADEALLARVADMVRASETRQGAVLSARLAELDARGEAQRRYDLARIGAGLSYLDGKSVHQMARTSELMGYLLQASEKR